MTPDITKKPTVNPMVIEKLSMVLTGMGVPVEIVDKIKSILGAGKEVAANLETAHADEENLDEQKGETPSSEGEEDTSMNVDPKKKLSLNGVKVICITE